MTDSEYILANSDKLVNVTEDFRIQLDVRFMRILARRSGLRSNRWRHVKKRGKREIMRLIDEYMEKQLTSNVLRELNNSLEERT